MKRILLLAAGALGTAGMIALAAPASADAPAPATPQSELQTFRDSVDPKKVVNEFLNGNCAAYPKGCPAKDMNPGVLNQFDYFRQNLQGQSKAFGDSIDPKKQLDSFVKSITDPDTKPATP